MLFALGTSGFVRLLRSGAISLEQQNEASEAATTTSSTCGGVAGGGGAAATTVATTTSTSTLVGDGVDNQHKHSHFSHS